jgi:hypothetical protein
MSGAHTPGPWAVEFTERPIAGSELAFRINGSGKIHICSGQSQEHLGDDGAIHAAECRANAHLLLAAPDLLAVLQEMLPRFCGLREMAGLEPSALSEQASAAIAKAQGGAA